MVKGKYAAKAANRAAALDNQVIAQLRGELSDAKAENVSLRAELDAARRRNASEVNRLVDAQMARERAAHAADNERITAELAQRDTDIAEELIELLASWVAAYRDLYGDDVKIPSSLTRSAELDGPSVVRILTMLLGEDARIDDAFFRISGMEDTYHGRRGRYLRRRTAAKLSRDLEFAARLQSLGFDL